jgi:hypothetical protein
MTNCPECGKALEPLCRSCGRVSLLESAKRRFLKKCQGPRAITPIEVTNVESIIDQFIQELDNR